MNKLKMILILTLSFFTANLICDDNSYIVALNFNQKPVDIQIIEAKTTIKDKKGIEHVIPEQALFFNENKESNLKLKGLLSRAIPAMKTLKVKFDNNISSENFLSKKDTLHIFAVNSISKDGIYTKEIDLKNNNITAEEIKKKFYEIRDAKKSEFFIVNKTEKSYDVEIPDLYFSGSAKGLNVSRFTVPTDKEYIINIGTKKEKININNNNTAVFYLTEEDDKTLTIESKIINAPKKLYSELNTFIENKLTQDLPKNSSRICLINLTKESKTAHVYSIPKEDDIEIQKKELLLEIELKSEMFYALDYNKDLKLEVVFKDNNKNININTTYQYKEKTRVKGVKQEQTIKFFVLLDTKTKPIIIEPEYTTKNALEAAKSITKDKSIISEIASEIHKFKIDLSENIEKTIKNNTREDLKAIKELEEKLEKARIALKEKKENIEKELYEKAKINGDILIKKHETSKIDKNISEKLFSEVPKTDKDDSDTPPAMN